MSNKVNDVFERAKNVIQVMNAHTQRNTLLRPQYTNKSFLSALLSQVSISFPLSVISVCFSKLRRVAGWPHGPPSGLHL